MKASLRAKIQRYLRDLRTDQLQAVAEAANDPVQLAALAAEENYPPKDVPVVRSLINAEMARRGLA